MLLVGQGTPRTIYRQTAAMVNGVWTTSSEAPLTVIGDLLPVGDDRRVDVPQGFTKAGMRRLHLARGQTELRPWSVLAGLPADELAVTLDGVTTRMVCIGKMDHLNDTAGLTMGVDHIGYLFAIPENIMSGETGVGR